MLIKSLEAIGIRGKLLEWFNSYLLEREIMVKVGSTLSVKRRVDTGVPQGSILGPTLYIIYVNNMVKYIKNCQVYQYADDTVLLSANKDVHIAEQELQTDFSMILKWTHDRNLVINAEKTKLVHICSPHALDRDYYVNIICHSHECMHDLVLNCNCGIENGIENVISYKYLGIIIDRFFSWKPQINIVSKRLRSCAFKIYNLKYVLPFKVLRAIYLALAESVIMYGILAWGNASPYIIKQIRKLQSKILYHIIPDHKKIEIKHEFDLYNFCLTLPVNLIYEFQLILKYYFNNDYLISEVSEIITRARMIDVYKIPSYNNKYGKRQLKYVIPLLFNQIPQHLRNLKKYQILKNELKIFVRNKLLLSNHLL